MKKVLFTLIVLTFAASPALGQWAMGFSQLAASNSEIESRKTKIIELIDQSYILDKRVLQLQIDNQNHQPVTQSRDKAAKDVGHKATFRKIVSTYLGNLPNKIKKHSQYEHVCLKPNMFFERNHFGCLTQISARLAMDTLRVTVIIGGTLFPQHSLTSSPPARGLISFGSRNGPPTSTGGAYGHLPLLFVGLCQIAVTTV